MRHCLTRIGSRFCATLPLDLSTKKWNYTGDAMIRPRRSQNALTFSHELRPF